MNLHHANPVLAGVDAFTKIVGTMNTLEDSKARREMMKKDMADRDSKREFEKKAQDRQQKAWAEEDEKKYGQQTLNDLVSVFDAAENAERGGKKLDVAGLSDNQVSAVLKMGGHKGFFDESGKVIPEKVEALRSLHSVLQSPEMVDAMQNKKKISIDLTKDQKISDAIHAVWGEELIAGGVDRAGNPANKRAATVLLDFSTDVPTVAFELEVEPPKNGAGNMVPAPGYEKDVFNIPEDPRPVGQVERGNIDLSSRKVAINGDGTISTVLSRSFNFDGKEVLLPLVNDAGKVVSDKEAIAEYKRTGKHLGIFESPEAATRYAEKLHSSKIWQPTIEYYAKGSYRAPMTWGRDANPEAPIKQIPAMFLQSKLMSTERLSDWINQLEARYGSTEFSKRVQAARQARDEQTTVLNTLETHGQDKTAFSRELVRKGMPVDKVEKYSKTLTEKGESEKQPTRASLAMDAAKGDKTAKKALDLMDKKDAAGEKDGINTAKEGLKDRRLREAADEGYIHGDAVVKLAQGKIRKNEKLDAHKAVEDARKEINSSIKAAGTSSKALEKLIAMGVSDADARDAIKLYIEQTKKEKK